MTRRIPLSIVVFFLFVTGLTAVIGQSVINSPHNLSVTGPGSIRASSEAQVCIFCHTPHNSSPQAPLWNRESSGSTYILYSSSTTDAAPGQPTGATVLCLSCHDGTVALGNVLSRGQPITMLGGTTTLPAGSSNLSTDLSDDHPVSFHYNSSVTLADGQLADPATLTGAVQLESGQMQCTSCHDPHDNSLGDFLVTTTQFSDLCLQCHQKTEWNQSTHSSSPATWNGSGTDPWFHTPYTSVAANACENCHNPHSASAAERLLNFASEEDNCMNCHNGNVAGINLQTQLNKPYRHPITSFAGIHDPNEPNVVLNQHVECVDCHNPHASNDAAATAPNANGFIAGVKGVDTDGNPVEQIQFLYQLCYRCHSDSPTKPTSPTTRQIDQNNVRLEFDPANPSYHPIEAAGKNPNVPSLIAPLSEASQIYCTDCHASDGAGSPAGPHGSIYINLLKYQYSRADNTPESAQNYALCYSCHDRNSIINRTGNFGRRVHREHVIGQDTPCNACHDPHGISSNQGTTVNNTHLINFDLGIVQPNSNGQLMFVDQGNEAGACYLRCHGENHNPKSY
jgi:predicted CXXCH cytochrome family protein